MRVYETDMGIHIFIHNEYFDGIDWNKKDEVEDVLRKMLHHIREYFNIQLKGFYKIKIYPNKIGTFMEVVKLDDDIYDYSEIDFRVVVIYNKDMYFEFEDYSLIDHEEVFFYQDSYYISIQYIDNYFTYADMGRVVFLDDVDFNKCIYINKKD